MPYITKNKQRVSLRDLSIAVSAFLAGNRIDAIMIMQRRHKLEACERS